MKNQDIINALNKTVNQNYHFSDYDVKNIISERRNILIGTYKNFTGTLLGKLMQEKTWKRLIVT